jgi:membrane-associated protease RseP (regulator of RpoE activity)
MNRKLTQMRRRRRLVGLALVTGVALTSAGAAWGQVAGQPAATQACPGTVVGTLGIVDMDCRGCALRLTRPRGSSLWIPSWSFSAEPQITAIAPDSPAAGVLEVGDRIVAVDGLLITTAEGGRRFANLAPDSTATIRYRRDGRTYDAVLRASSRCGPALEGAGHLEFPTIVGDSVSGRAVTWNGPGILIQTWTTAHGRRTVMTFPGWQVGLRRSGGTTTVEIPEARYGMNFSCGSCSSTLRDGRRVWRFSNPIEVLGVAEGGPAERAGMLVGDRITHVDGIPIDTERGGEAFSNVRPGRATRLTVIGRDGRERTVTIVPPARI